MERHQIRGRLADQSTETRLTGRITHCLSKSRGRDRDPQPQFGRAFEKRDYLAVVPIERDQSTGIESNAP
jgi:hypothetical protein